MNMVGILLAGGKSTRMQTDKALLPWAESDLLTSQYQKLKSILVDDCDKIYVSGFRPGFNYVADIQPELGPLEGVRSVCRQLQNLQTSILVMPVDMPLISDSVLQYFVRQFHRISSVHNKSALNPDNSTNSNDKNLKIDLKQTTVNKFLLKFKNYELPIIYSNAEMLLEAIEHLKKQKHKKLSFKELGFYFQNIQIQNPQLNTDIFLNTNTMEDWNAALSKTNVAF